MQEEPKAECHQFEHTADVGLRCTAPTLEGLFECAARGMFEIIACLQEVEPAQSVPVSLTAANLEELFISWLEELLYIWETKRLLLSKFKVNKLDSNSLEAEVMGETYDENRHELDTEVKAATYHDLHIEQEENACEVRVIFDL